MPACGRRGGGHRLGIGQRSGERLLAGDVLAGLEGGDRLLGVNVVRRADVDEPDVVGGDRGAPVGGRGAASPSVRRTRAARSALRPTTVCIVGCGSTAKNLATFSQALEWARPMNFEPSSATLIVPVTTSPC